jgi:predicted esterase
MAHSPQHHLFTKGTTGATLLLLHGEGGDEKDFLPIIAAIAPGAGALSPRLSRLGESPEEVAEDAAAFAHWLGHAIEEYNLDAARIFALGHGDGANLASALILLHPGLLAGAILLRPRRVVEPNPLPKLASLPVLVAGGEGDETMPAGESEQLARLLSHVGADVDYALAETGHDLSPSDFVMCKRWIEEMLPAKAG